VTANQITVNKYASQCRLFLKVIADGNRDMMISEITIQHVQAYASKLSKLPKKTSPEDPRSIDDIIASSTPRTSARTKFTHAQAVNMFLKWCQGQQYRIAPNLGGILTPSLKKPKPDKRRKHFTDDELKLLFESRMCQQGTFERDSDCWLPILGLFTGARQAELCQLLSSDVRKEPETSLWYIDINEDGDKRLKTDSSPRQVPIHPVLEQLKFVEFSQRASSNRGGRLFPGEKRNGVGEFGTYSKRFNRYRESQGIKNTPATHLNYHSLRHTLQNDLLGQGHQEHVINDIVGHSQAGRSEGVRTYSSGASLDAKREMLLKFRYNLKLTARIPANLAKP
jgi:integrase